MFPRYLLRFSAFSDGSFKLVRRRFRIRHEQFRQQREANAQRRGIVVPNDIDHPMVSPGIVEHVTIQDPNLSEKSQLRADSITLKEHNVGNQNKSEDCDHEQDASTPTRSEAPSPDDPRRWKRFAGTSYTYKRQSSRKRGPPPNPNALIENPQSSKRRRRKRINKRSTHIKSRVSRQSEADAQYQDAASSNPKGASSLLPSSARRSPEAFFEGGFCNQPYTSPVTSQAKTPAPKIVDDQQSNPCDGPLHTQECKHVSIISDVCECRGIHCCEGQPSFDRNASDPGQHHLRFTAHQKHH